MPEASDTNEECCTRSINKIQIKSSCLMYWDLMGGVPKVACYRSGIDVHVQGL